MLASGRPVAMQFSITRLPIFETIESPTKRFIMLFDRGDVKYTFDDFGIFGFFIAKRNSDGLECLEEYSRKSIIIDWKSFSRLPTEILHYAFPSF